MRLIIGLAILIIIAVLLYVNGNIFFSERDDLLKNQLPLGIKADNRPEFEGGFALKDQYGLTIAAKGNTYKFGDKEILIDKVKSFCWDKNGLIATVGDVKGAQYLVAFSAKPGTNSNDVLIAKVFHFEDRLVPRYDKCQDVESSRK